MNAYVNRFVHNHDDLILRPSDLFRAHVHLLRCHLVLATGM